MWQALTKQPELRPSAAQLLDHAWIRTYARQPHYISCEPASSSQPAPLYTQPTLRSNRGSSCDELLYKRPSRAAGTELEPDRLEHLLPACEQLSGPCSAGDTPLWEPLQPLQLFADGQTSNNSQHSPTIETAPCNQQDSSTLAWQLSSHTVPTQQAAQMERRKSIDCPQQQPDTAPSQLQTTELLRPPCLRQHSWHSLTLCTPPQRSCSAMTGVQHSCSEAQQQQPSLGGLTGSLATGAKMDSHSSWPLHGPATTSCESLRQTKCSHAARSSDGGSYRCSADSCSNSSNRTNDGGSGSICITSGGAVTLTHGVSPVRNHSCSSSTNANKPHTSLRQTNAQSRMPDNACCCNSLTSQSHGEPTARSLPICSGSLQPMQLGSVVNPTDMQSGSGTTVFSSLVPQQLNIQWLAAMQSVFSASASILAESFHSIGACLT